jgi:cobalt-precorrin 5A hydrolase/precorrin-3B C17-methyltransferase
MRTIIFILGPSALPLASRLRGLLFAEIHGPQGIEGVNFNYSTATDHLAQMFREGHRIIGICAAGILVRAIGPHAKDKHSEPPVIALSEDGEFAVPLLGGHHGANELARKIADLTSGHAAVTNASDVALGISLDVVPSGITLATPDLVKPLTARLLQGERLIVTEGVADWLLLVQSPNGHIPARVTHQIARPDVLTYHAQTLVVGIGCERGTSVEEVAALIEATLAVHDIARASIFTFASIDLKEDEAAITALSPVQFFTLSLIHI